MSDAPVTAPEIDVAELRRTLEAAPQLLSGDYVEWAYKLGARFHRYGAGLALLDKLDADKARIAKLTNIALHRSAEAWNEKGRADHVEAERDALRLTCAALQRECDAHNAARPAMPKQRVSGATILEYLNERADWMVSYGADAVKAEKRLCADALLDLRDCRSALYATPPKPELVTLRVTPEAIEAAMRAHGCFGSMEPMRAALTAAVPLCSTMSEADVRADERARVVEETISTIKELLNRPWRAPGEIEEQLRALASRRKEEGRSS